MAKPYTDGELANERGPLCSESEGSGEWEDRLQATVRRLLRERDEARSTARELASAIDRREPCEYGPTCGAGVCPEVRRALAYGLPHPALPCVGGTRHGV